MWKTKKTIGYGWVAALAGCGLLSLGCGTDSGSTEQGTGPVESSQQAPQASAPSPDLEQHLVGIWLGDARIDQAELEARFSKLSPQKQLELESIVGNFLTTVMAMQYTAEGTFEEDVEMMINGRESLRDASIGSYEVVSTAGDTLKLKVKEQTDGGETLTSERLFRFSADRDQCEVTVPLGAEWTGITAKLVFTKQNMESVAEQSDLNAVTR